MKFKIQIKKEKKKKKMKKKKRMKRMEMKKILMKTTRRMIIRTTKPFVRKYKIQALTKD